jgi:hypothetical protein
MTDRNDSKIAIEIDGATALVLFEMLTRFENSEVLSLEDEAEEYALWALQALLERRLVAPLQPNYAEQLRAARADVRRRYG